MKKLLLSALTLASFTSAIAQTNFFTKTCYRGAFAPAPNEMWTKDWAEFDPQNKVYPAPTVTISANITSNTTWATGTTVFLSGVIYVKGNSILTIQPGVVIRASKAANGSALVVTKGSQLIANGTATAPIVFTSDQAPGSRGVGDWGGIILLGSAALNYTTGINNVEGLPVSVDTEFGGGTTPNNNDNSGSLKYVRIEFGGYVYQPNKEINGLTMGAVGKGTTLEYIQTSYINDDAFEWFGGNVNAKWLVSFRNLDDDFDTDNGWSGNVQFGLVVRDPNLADNPTVSTSEGFESDNDANGTTAAPQTSGIFSNITLLGPLRGAVTNSVASGYRRGARIRRNSGLKIYNSIFMDFRRGVHIDGTLCEANANTGVLKFKHNIIAGYEIGRAVEQNVTNTFTNATTWLTTTSGNDTLLHSNPSFSLILSSPYSFTSGDYRPTNSSIALAGASFTDAALASVTGTSSNQSAFSVLSSTCIGQGSTVTGTANFVASSTIAADYCSFSWSVSPGVTISSTSAINPSFTISTFGTFTIYLVVNDGNGQNSMMQTVTTNTCLDVSVKENSSLIGSVNLFPNPSNDATTLTVSSKTGDLLNVNVYDLTGKMVLSPVQNQQLINGENKYTLNTQELTNGIYFVTLSTINGKETVKLVVNK
jgi:hypothetical protein